MSALWLCPTAQRILTFCGDPVIPTSAKPVGEAHSLWTWLSAFPSSSTPGSASFSLGFCECSHHVLPPSPWLPGGLSPSSLQALMFFQIRFKATFSYFTLFLGNLIYIYSLNDRYTEYFPLYSPLEIFFLATLCICGILVPRPGFKTTPYALGAWSLNSWTAREVLKSLFWMLVQYFQYLCRIPHECSRIIPILKLTS